MREIKNNVEIGKMQNADLRLSKSEKAEPQAISEGEESSIKDFSNPTEVLGRSQVNSTDNLKSDVKFGLANPDAIASSDKLFNIAYSQLLNENDPQAYEKACAIATATDARDLLTK